MATKLRPPFRDEPLPSVDFLVIHYAGLRGPSTSDKLAGPVHSSVLYSFQYCVTSCSRSYLSTELRKQFISSIDVFCRNHLDGPGCGRQSGSPTV
jgi:hypothetical protein